MKIVDRKPIEPYQFPFTCRKCGSVLVAEASDVKIGSFCNYLEGWNSFYVTCPVCKKIRVLEDSEVTEEVADAVRKRRRRKST